MQSTKSQDLISELFDKLLEQFVVNVSTNSDSLEIDQSELDEIKETDNVLGTLDDNYRLKKLYALSQALGKLPSDDPLNSYRKNVVYMIFALEVCKKYPAAIRKNIGVRKEKEKGLKIVWYNPPPREALICISGI